MADNASRGQLAKSSLPRLDPKLRLIANGNVTVNARRAEQCSCLRIDSDAVAERVRPVLSQAAPPPPPKAPFKRGHQEAIPNELSASVFVETVAPGLAASLPEGVRLSATRAGLHTATVPLSVLDQLATHPSVVRVQRGLAWTAPRTATVPPRKSDAAFKRAARRRQIKLPANVGLKPVLVGIIDVGGYDFAHPDFLDAQGNSRFVRIWDQAGTAQPSPAERDPEQRPSRRLADYGSELRQEDLNAALAESQAARVPPNDLEPQSQMVIGSHATHVASIAAGNGGVCPQALIAGVVLALTEADEDRRRSFYDSTRVVHAVEYLLSLGEEFDCPVSINISLGTNGHAHDASEATSRWIDAALAQSGRCVAVAAGNAGQERPAYSGDLGWVTGRVHTAGRIPAGELVKDLDWVVVGNGIEDVSENELELWYSAQDRFAVQLRPPRGNWMKPIEPREFIENQRLASPLRGFVSIYNELYHPSNGSNYIAIYLSPEFRSDTIVGVPSGVWTVRLLARRVRDGWFDGWIERDDPRRIGRIGDREAWSFPSFFGERSFVDESSVSSLACGNRVLSVGNLDEDAERINVTSSQGPSRDKRYKPDVVAPGTGIVAANGFAGPDDLWTVKTGTSMASPYVAGVAALMLAIAPELTAAQIEGIVRGTSRPLPGASFAWLNDAGFGRITPEACLEEAANANDRRDRTPQ